MGDKFKPVEVELDKDINVDICVEVDWDVDVDVYKCVDVYSDIYSDVDVYGNAAVFNVTCEAIGYNTFADLELTATTIEHCLSEVSACGQSATEGFHFGVA